MRHGKIQAKIVRSTTRKAKIKEVEFFSGASEKQSTVRNLSILNFHCTVVDQNKIGQSVTLDSFTIQRFV
jgi:hypothetical protein